LISAASGQRIPKNLSNQTANFGAELGELFFLQQAARAEEQDLMQRRRSTRRIESVRELGIPPLDQAVDL